MKMYARVADNDHLAEFISFDPVGRFHPSITWIEIPDDVQPWVDGEWIYRDGAIEPETLDKLRASMLVRLADRRWNEQVKGVDVEIAGESVRFNSDRDTRTDLQGKYQIGQISEGQNGEGSYSFTFKAASGPVTMQLPDILTVGFAIDAHVQACFDREAAIAAILDAKRATHTLIEAFNAEIDTGWPSTAAEA